MAGNGFSAFLLWRMSLGGESPTAVMQNANQPNQGQHLAFDTSSVNPEMLFL